MNPESYSTPDTNIIQYLGRIIDTLIEGKQIEQLPELEFQSDNEELMLLTEKVRELAWQYANSYQFIMDLAQGKLDTEPPPKNSIANQFKALQAELRHLTWQMKQISKGDYTQNVYFMGDFSEAFQSMTEILSEKNRLDAENRELREKYQMLAENTLESIWLFDITNQKTCYVSPSIFKLRGITVEQAMQENLEQSLSKQSLHYFKESRLLNFAKLMERASNGEKIERTYNIQQLHANGSLLDIETSVNIFKNKDDDTVYALGVSRDITRRKELEREIKQKNLELEYLNRSKDTFFSIIAHDLRNPFNGLIGLSELLIENLQRNNTTDALSMASIILKSSTEGYNLLTNLLDWARINRGKMEVTIEQLNLSEIIKSSIALLWGNAIEKEITLKMDLAPSQMIQADKNMVNTVVRNILTNAIKFTHQKGEVTITTTYDDKFATISIRDNGIGISQDALQKLFRIDSQYKRTGTNNESGTGLGLVLSREFVIRMGGDITATSEPNKGSNFVFTIPLAKD